MGILFHVNLPDYEKKIEFLESRLSTVSTTDSWILDAGCGENNPILSQEKARYLFGCDIDLCALQKNKVVSNTVVADLHMLPFSEKFNLLVSIDVLEHIEDPSAFLQQANKVLKDYGYLFLVLPNKHSLFGLGAALVPLKIKKMIYKALIGKALKNEVHYYRLNTVSDLRNSLKRNGFELIEIVMMNYLSSHFRMRMVFYPYYFLCKIPFFSRCSLSILCIAQKKYFFNPPFRILNSEMGMMAWYFNRLRLMSFPEVVLRFYRWGRNRAWEILLPWVENKKKFIKAKAGESDPQGEWLKTLQGKFPITLDQNFWERYSRYFPQEQVKEVGENLVRGKIPVFDWIYDTGGGVPDWHRDVLSPVPWPKVFFSQLNHNDLRYGRVINVWELNRHFHFYDLGKAYSLTKDKRFAQTLMAHLESWIDQNPPGIGVNWYSPMENGLRLISWLWGLFFISEALKPNAGLPLTPETERKILTSIYWQAYFIEKNLSKYSSANNHLIGEALGLFWVGSLLPSFPRAEKWRKKGWDILCREISKQVFPDGVPREQSSRYLFYLFDLYTLAIRLAQKENLTIPQALWDRLEKICEYIMAQMDEGGNLPDLGDSSDGLACKLHTAAFHPYRSLLTTGAIWFKRGDFKYWGEKIDERNFWLFNEEDLSEYEKVKEDPGERGSRVFPDGGQIILRKGRGAEEAVLSFDAGPFGYLSIAAHAHADALSFTLSLGGTPVLIDPGTYLYHDGGRWRYFFRGTRAHNTIEVDGEDQAVSGGPFMWLSRPRVFIKKIVILSDYDYVQASHAGYDHLSDPVLHERSILFNKKEEFWTIKDRLESKGSHSLLQIFHFHPDCQIKPAGINLFEVSVHGFILYFKQDPQLTSSIHRGEEDPVLGWFSPAFGKKEPTITLAGEKQIQGSECFQTRIWKAEGNHSGR